MEHWLTRTFKNGISHQKGRWPLVWTDTCCIESSNATPNITLHCSTEPFLPCHYNRGHFPPLLRRNIHTQTRNANTHRCTQPLPERASEAGSQSWLGTGPNDARHASALDNGGVTPANFYQGVNVSISKRLVPRVRRSDQRRDCGRSGCCSEPGNRWVQWACSARRSLFLLLYAIFSHYGGGMKEQVWMWKTEPCTRMGISARCQLEAFLFQRCSLSNHVLYNSLHTCH